LRTRTVEFANCAFILLSLKGTVSRDGGWGKALEW
jgi:hypothetical protein